MALKYNKNATQDITMKPINNVQQMMLVGLVKNKAKIKQETKTVTHAHTQK